MAKLKDDLNVLFKQVREVEKRTENLALESNTINSSVQTLIKTMGDFMETFNNHDRNEMQKYTDIEKSNIETNSRLKALEDLRKMDKVQYKKDRKRDKKERKKLEDTLTTMSENQSKFFRYINIVTGVVLAVTAIGAIIMFVLDVYEKVIQ